MWIRNGGHQRKCMGITWTNIRSLWIIDQKAAPPSQQEVLVVLLVQPLVCHQVQRGQEERESARHLLLVAGSLVLLAHIAQLQQRPARAFHIIGTISSKCDWTPNKNNSVSVPSCYTCQPQWSSLSSQKGWTTELNFTVHLSLSLITPTKLQIKTKSTRKRTK